MTSYNNNKSCFTLSKGMLKAFAALKNLDTDFGHVKEIEIVKSGSKIIAKYSPDTFYYPYEKLNTLVGVAECSEGDEYDEELGTRLAVCILLKKTFDMTRHLMYDVQRRWESVFRGAEASISHTQDRLRRAIHHYSTKGVSK